MATINDRINKTRRSSLATASTVPRRSASGGRRPATVTDIGRVNQVTTNLNSVKAEVDSASGVVQDAVSLLDQARTLGAQGASSTLSAQARTSLAAQAQQILSALVDASRATFAGRYLFSGDDSTQPAYDVNLANPNGVDRLITPPIRLIQDSNGVVSPYPRPRRIFPIIEIPTTARLPTMSPAA